MSRILKICRVVTVPHALTSIEKQILLIQEQGHQVTIICSRDNKHLFLKEKYKNIYFINISREISPIQDIISIIKLFCHFIIHRYDIVHSSTPKAGLLVAISGFLARNPIRIHTFTGQRWATLNDVKKWLLIFSDKIIVRLNHYCYADSFSQIKILEKYNVARTNSIKCIGKGSFGGVDLIRFRPIPKEQRPKCENILGIRHDKFRFLYIGRIVKDKGLNELLKAFDILTKKHKNTELLIIGSSNGESDFVNDVSEDILKNNKMISKFDFTNTPELYMQVSDVFVLPSYREGLSTVILESAACGIPSIGSDISGINDIILNNKTGLLIPKGNMYELLNKMEWIIQNTLIIKEMGAAARKYIEENFDANNLTHEVIKEYRRIIEVINEHK